MRKRLFRFKLKSSIFEFLVIYSSITEEQFWRNYFYRMSLIVQANEADHAPQRQASADDPQGN